MTPGSGPIARRLCVLAVLLGLVGMHGLANGPGDRCHGGVSSPGALSAMMSTTPTEAVTAQHVVAGMRDMGSVCVFVQSAGWPGMTLALVALATVALGCGAATRWSVGGRPGRSPPLAGMSLLHRVCVSLT
jgi:hypothetical protein